MKILAWKLLMIPRRSASHIKFPKTNRRDKSKPTEDNAAQPKNGRKRVRIPGGRLGTSKPS